MALPFVPGGIGTARKALKATKIAAEAVGATDNIVSGTKSVIDGVQNGDTLEAVIGATQVVSGSLQLDNAAQQAGKLVKGGSEVVQGGTKAAGNVVGEKNIKKPYANSRPQYGKNQVEQVWENAIDPNTGKVFDPTGKEITWDKTKPRNGQWDMGHIPEEKYSEVHQKYMNGEMTKDEFIKWYQTPENYRPELPSTNRSHKCE